MLDSAGHEALNPFDDVLRKLQASCWADAAVPLLDSCPIWQRSLLLCLLKALRCVSKRRSFDVHALAGTLVLVAAAANAQLSRLVCLVPDSLPTPGHCPDWAVTRSVRPLGVCAAAWFDTATFWTDSAGVGGPDGISGRYLGLKQQRLLKPIFQER